MKNGKYLISFIILFSLMACASSDTGTASVSGQSNSNYRNSSPSVNNVRPKDSVATNPKPNTPSINSPISSSNNSYNVQTTPNSGYYSNNSNGYTNNSSFSTSSNNSYVGSTTTPSSGYYGNNSNGYTSNGSYSTSSTSSVDSQSSYGNTSNNYSNSSSSVEDVTTYSDSYGNIYVVEDGVFVPYTGSVSTNANSYDYRGDTNGENACTTCAGSTSDSYSNNEYSYSTSSSTDGASYKASSTTVKKRMDPESVFVFLKVMAFLFLVAWNLGLFLIYTHTKNMSYHMRFIKHSLREKWTFYKAIKIRKPIKRYLPFMNKGVALQDSIESYFKVYDENRLHFSNASSSYILDITNQAQSKYKSEYEDSGMDGVAGRILNLMNKGIDTSAEYRFTSEKYNTIRRDYKHLLRRANTVYLCRNKLDEDFYKLKCYCRANIELIQQTINYYEPSLEQPMPVVVSSYINDIVKPSSIVHAGELSVVTAEDAFIDTYDLVNDKVTSSIGDTYIGRALGATAGAALGFMNAYCQKSREIENMNEDILSLINETKNLSVNVSDNANHMISCLEISKYIIQLNRVFWTAYCDFVASINKGGQKLLNSDQIMILQRLASSYSGIVNA